MDIKSVNIVAHNYPEAISTLNEKLNVKNIIDKKREFIKFEGVNFVFRYKIKVIVLKKLPKCQECGEPIKGRPAWFNRKKVCQYCFGQLTKGY